nr:hypothetical protein [Tanacetum cinerariifolium]
MKVFPLSLSGDARKWWMNKGDGKITTWEELVKKFLRKFYPLSCVSNYDKMCVDDDEGRDPLEFIPWNNSKFKDHKKMDETTKHALLYTWIELRNEEGLMNNELSSNEEWEEHEDFSWSSMAAMEMLEFYLRIDSSGWSFVSAVLGQMTYLVASLTLDSANSYVIQGASCTQRKVSMVLFSTPFVLSWGGSISSDSFLPSILLLVVIIITVVIVVVILIVFIVAITGVVIVVVGDVSSILKLSFVIIGWAYAFHQDKASSVRVSVANVTLFSSAQLLRENTDSVRSNQRMSPITPFVPFK